MTTAADIVNDALELAGVLEGGETPSANDANRSLRALNDMLESWGTERQNVYALTTEQFPLTGQQQYTIGEDTTGGPPDFQTVRPLAIDPSTFVRMGDMDYTLAPLSPTEYANITIKSWSGPWPQAFYYDTTFPNATIYFYPVDSGGTLFLSSWKSFSPLATLQSQVVMPPGYNRALKYSLAEELVPLFNVPMPAKLEQIAMKARRNIKRMNVPDVTMYFPPALWSRAQFNIYAGQ